jgi:hypothetical protein
MVNHYIAFMGSHLNSFQNEYTAQVIERQLAMIARVEGNHVKADRAAATDVRSKLALTG